MLLSVAVESPLDIVLLIQVGERIIRDTEVYKKIATIHVSGI